MPAILYHVPLARDWNTKKSFSCQILYFFICNHFHWAGSINLLGLSLLHPLYRFQWFLWWVKGSLARDGPVPQTGKGEGRGPAGGYSHTGPPGTILSPEARFTVLRWMGEKWDWGGKKAIKGGLFIGEETEVEKRGTRAAKRRVKKWQK